MIDNDRMVTEFASDNHAGVHPEILDAIAAANTGHQPAYGGDDITRRFEALVREHFGESARGYPMWGGTGANVVGLAALLRPHEAVVCADTAHIHTDECGALERFQGGKLVTIPTADGKLTPQAVASRLAGTGAEHQRRPRVVSISQVTELGTCYSRAEIADLAAFAHRRGLHLHLDGARLANAAAWADCALGELTTGAGVDMLSFGGTKNGALGAEAVVAARPGLADDLRFVRKQATQLASKMRFVSAQLVALLTDELWRRNAGQANAMARRLADGAAAIPGLSVDSPVQANAVFATLPRESVAKLQELWSFHVWADTGTNHQRVRWMTSFDTVPGHVDAFLADIRAALNL